MKALQRVGPIALLAQHMRARGIDPAIIARRCAVDLDSLKPDMMVPLADILHILDEAIAVSQDELLGVKLAMDYRWHHHGIIHQLTLTAPNLRHALLDFSMWQRLYSTGAVVYLQRIEQDYALGYGVYASSHRSPQNLYPVSLRIGLNLLHDLTGGAVKPVEVHLSIRPPRDIATFRRLFECPILFNQSQNVLIISGRDIDRAMPHYDPHLRDTITTQLRCLYAAKRPLAWDVQRLIRPHLLREDPSMEGVAAALKIHPRTLRRGLKAEGTNFEYIRDDVRNTMAHEFLSVTELSIGEISAILAFSSHAAFVRAFQRWNGMTPSAWRGQRSSDHIHST